MILHESSQTILVYNPISGHGHLDSWNAIFIALLLERGYRVLALTPDSEALKRLLARRGLSAHPCLRILCWEIPRAKRSVSWYRRLQVFGAWSLTILDCYGMRRKESRITPDMKRVRRYKKRLLQLLVPPLYQASHLFRRLFKNARSQGFEADDLEISFLAPEEMAYRIKNALRQIPDRPAVLFNMYMDMYKTDHESWQAFAKTCRLPWGGIRFVPSPVPPAESYYTLTSLIGMCFLDVETCRKYANKMPEKRFFYIPDIANVELPENTPPLAEEIHRRAASRKILFMGGSISGQKNLARWCELIARADSARWFFAQVGEIHYNTLTPEDARAFEDLIGALPENVLLYTKYLPDETDFNAVIKMADIIFAVYRDFRISSNMLAKAAALEKPILAAEGFLVGEKTLSYGIGRVVPETDVGAMLVALDDMIGRPVPRENFTAYRNDFSERTVADTLENFISYAITRK